MLCYIDHHDISISNHNSYFDQYFRKKVEEKEEKLRKDEEAGEKEMEKDNKRLQKLRDVNVNNPACN